MAVETPLQAEPEADYLSGAIARSVARGEPLVLSIPDTARLLGISRALAYDLARRGEIPTMRLGRRRVVPRTALAALVAGSSGEVA